MKMKKNAKLEFIGFFPGLGSRSSYISNKFEGDNRVEGSNFGLDVRDNNIGFSEKHRDIACDMLSYNINDFLKLKRKIKGKGIFTAFSGESLGIIAAMVAAESISLDDGMKIAGFFTPYVLLSSCDYNDDYSKKIRNYHPLDFTKKKLIENNYHVISLHGREKDILEIESKLCKHFKKREVEVNKYYSAKQLNIYVSEDIKNYFHVFMSNYPSITTLELKKPTVFLAHSIQLTILRAGLEKYISDEGIVISNPKVPIISNNGSGIIINKEGIKKSILDLLNKPMLSSESARLSEAIHPDAIIEIGLGNKTIKLLKDNNVNHPLVSSGDLIELNSKHLMALRLINNLTNHRDVKDALNQINRWIDFSKEFSNVSAIYNKSFSDAINEYNDSKIELSCGEKISLNSIYKNSTKFNNFINKGELVLFSRVKKNIYGNAESINSRYADLTIINKNGEIKCIKTPFISASEKNIFYCSRMDNMSNEKVYKKIQDIMITSHYHEIVANFEANSSGLDLVSYMDMDLLNSSYSTYVIRRVLLQYFFIEHLRTLRPNLTLSSNFCLGASDIVGWLAITLVSGVFKFIDVYNFCNSYFSMENRSRKLDEEIHELTKNINKPILQLMSVNGGVIKSIQNIKDNTKEVTEHSSSNGEIKLLLDCDLTIITLDSSIDDYVIDMSYRQEVIILSSIEDIYNNNYKINSKETEACMNLTEEHLLTSNYAEKRNMLCSTISSYVELGELPILFCNGGSESMTMFLKSINDKKIFVRKILSEALTVARWEDDGKGVMLPPFEKAAKQVDYLDNLPRHLVDFFPKVYSKREREILVSGSKNNFNKDSCKEVIYDMSLVQGKEVSQIFLQRKFSPLVVAKVYESIFFFLRDNIHNQRKKVSIKNTLEISYFNKIEERLNLCIKTAPETFNERLLGSDKITINGKTYLNIKSILRLLRSRIDYQSIIEPKYHSLVMGDTNTENIKIINISLLNNVQDMIDAGESECEIRKHLEEINSENIGIRFLDPRAIGFESEGGDCVDDYMYDNKPWHNSLGHYDEIHNELFDINVNNKSDVLEINIDFHTNNAYAQSYNIQDFAVEDIIPSSVESQYSLEHHFSSIMNNIYSEGSSYLKDDPFWLVRFVFMMGTHFAAMPPFHFSSEIDGSLKDSYKDQKRPIAIYCEGIKWLNWAIELLEGKRTQFLGVYSVLPIEHLDEAV